MDLKKRVLQQIESVPDPGPATYRFASDLLKIVAVEADRLARDPRDEDSMAFPQMLVDVILFVREEGKKKSPGSTVGRKVNPNRVMVPIPPGLNIED